MNVILTGSENTKTRPLFHFVENLQKVMNQERKEHDRNQAFKCHGALFQTKEQ